MSSNTKTSSTRLQWPFIAIVVAIAVIVFVLLYVFDGWDLTSVLAVVIALLLGALIIGRVLAIARYDLR